MEDYLQLRQFTQAAAVISERLKQNLLTQTSDMLEMIEAYFVSEKTSMEDKKNLLEALAEVPINSEQSWWQEKLEQWRGLLTSTSVPKPAKAG
jgi:16S rRNA C1402 N4-methylase RsmH